MILWCNSEGIANAGLLGVPAVVFVTCIFTGHVAD